MSDLIPAYDDEERALETVKPITGSQFSAVLTRYKNGVSLERALNGICTWASFGDYLDANPHAMSEYDAALRQRSEKYLNEIVDIADTELDPIRARIRVDTRKYVIEKTNPKKYGNQVNINVTHSVRIDEALAEARARVLPLNTSDHDALTQRVEISVTNVPVRTDSESVTHPNEIDEPDHIASRNESDIDIFS